MREGDLWIAFFMLYYGQSYRLMKDIFCRLLEDKIRRHKHLDFKKWCEDNQYKAIPLDAIWEKDVEQSNMLLLHICENCNKQEVLTSEDGYKQGWDYPPKMGAFKVISPRTCGNCGIQTTLWWEITCNKTPPDQLSDKHQETLKRILTEPESITP